MTIHLRLSFGSGPFALPVLPRRGRLFGHMVRDYLLGRHAADLWRKLLQGFLVRSTLGANRHRSLHIGSICPAHL
jgi:hypothetical protein